MPPLTMSLRWMTPSAAAVARPRPAACRRRARSARRSPAARAGRAAVLAATQLAIASAAPLRICAAVEVDAAHARLGGERDERRRRARASSRPRRPYCSFASTTIERPSGVSSASEASCAASASSCSRHAGDRDELGRLPVAERDRAGLVEQQRVHVAGRLDRPAGHRQHVVLHQRDPCRRCRWPTAAPPIVVGIRQTSSATSTVIATAALPAVDRRTAASVTTASRKMMRQAGQQDVERDLVRRLLPLGALDQRDHPVEERLAGIRRDRARRSSRRAPACRR